MPERVRAWFARPALPCAAVLAAAMASACESTTGPGWTIEPRSAIRDSAYAVRLVSPTTLPHAVWSLASGLLPEGLVVTPEGGLEGIPTESGRFEFTFEGTPPIGPALQRDFRLWVIAFLRPDERCSDNQPTDVFAFADAALERAVRTHLDLRPQEITCADLRRNALTNLESTGGEPIRSLAGLQNVRDLVALYFTGEVVADLSPLAEQKELVTLFLNADSITDLSPLSGLPKLGWIELHGSGPPWSPLKDIGPLGDLPVLGAANLSRNSIADVRALGRPTTLQLLWLDHNEVGDISALSTARSLRVLSLRSQRSSLANIDALASLQSLTHVDVADNPHITDIGALRDLRNLRRVDLSSLPQLSDLSALVENAAFATGDTVLVGATAVGCAVVDALRAKGAAVLGRANPCS